jgi:hypothetical protein
MPIPSGYTYKDGGYWRLSDGTGPYGFAVGSSVPVLLAPVSSPPVGATSIYAGGYYWNLVGEGPFAKGT